VIQSVKSTPYKRRETMVIESNGIPMAFDKWVPALSVTYEVQLTNGAIVTVDSDGKFENGSCVQLKTSADLPVAGSDPAYNHILGLLSSAKNC